MIRCSKIGPVPYDRPPIARPPGPAGARRRAGVPDLRVSAIAGTPSLHHLDDESGELVGGHVLCGASGLAGNELEVVAGRDVGHTGADALHAVSPASLSLAVAKNRPPFLSSAAGVVRLAASDARFLVRARTTLSRGNDGHHPPRRGRRAPAIVARECGVHLRPKHPEGDWRSSGRVWHRPRRCRTRRSTACSNDGHGHSFTP
jgi:hypothetical protein